MSVNLPSHYVLQYANTIQLLLQQKMAKIAPFVTRASYVGKSASPVDQIGAVAMQAVSGRFNAMGRVDAAVDRRWVDPQDWDLPQLIDSFDKLRLLNDPSNMYVQNALAAANRKMDEIIVAAFFGSAKTGEQGATATAFPAAQQVAVNLGAAGNVGLTVRKLREARKILIAGEVDADSDPICAVVTAKQMDDIIGETQVASLDYNVKPALVDGYITKFMGINFVLCERLGVDGSGYRRIPVFAKSGMHLAMWNAPTTDISQRKDLQGLPWQAYLYLTLGATRLEEKKIVEIKCSEA